MRLPRFTTRRLMVLVAIVAVALTVGLCLSRSVLYIRLARYHSAQAGSLRTTHQDSLARLAEISKLVRLPEYDPVFQLLTRKARRVEVLAKYHEQLGRKYEHAARTPWLPVPPDPPPP